MQAWYHLYIEVRLKIKKVILDNAQLFLFEHEISENLCEIEKSFENNIKNLIKNCWFWFLN